VLAPVKRGDQVGVGGSIQIQQRHFEDRAIPTRAKRARAFSGRRRPSGAS
jgi:hypothetical protein